MTVKAISPDGAKLCLEEWSRKGYPLRVVEAGTWSTLFTENFSSRVLVVQFFADGDRLLTEFPPTPRTKALLFIAVDLESGARTEDSRPYFLPPAPSEAFYSLLGEKLLLVQGRNHVDRLALLEFPGFEEILSRTFPLRSGSGQYWNIGLSPGRSVAGLFVNSQVTLVRLDELSILWSTPLKIGLQIFKMDISREEHLVAAAIADTRRSEHETSYIAIYSGDDGEELARLPVSGINGIAISPGGGLLAVIVNRPRERGAVDVEVEVYGLLDGERIASLPFAQIPYSQRQPLLVGGTVRFTGDGRYLVMTGQNTRIWQVS